MPNEKIPHVVEPVPGPEAFARTDDAAVLSQAATLLLVGSQLRGDAPALMALAGERGRFVEALPEEDLSALGVPHLAAGKGLINAQTVRRFLGKRYGLVITEPVPVLPLQPHLPAEMVADVAHDFFREPISDKADNLLEVSLRHEQELIRVAAAVAYHERSPERDRLATILEQGTYNADELVRDLAATGLAQVAPGHVRLSELQAKGGERAAGASSDTTLLIHGTWAAALTWWQPGGDFHSYILANVRSDLYRNPDRFGWSGAYSDPARLQAARELVAWVAAHNENGLDLMTHSHGGSVAMLATHSGLHIGELVLLSCPVHIPKYLPDFSQVGKIVSIRVHLDLVILADRGGQRFRLPQIQENVLPIWFHHSATHDPSVWTRYNVKAML